jgi:hypothetical protein
LRILGYALSSLWRRRSKNLSILAVYTFTIAVLGSILLLTHSLRVEAFAILGDAPDLIVQRVAAGRHDLIPAAYMDSMREIPGVGSVHPRYWGYYYDAITGANYTLLGLGERLSVGVALVEGNLPSRPGECAIGVGVSEARQLGLGDELVLVDSRNVGVAFNVVGTFRSESNLLTYDLVVLSNRDLIEFFGLPEGEATDISLEVFNPTEVATVASKIKRVLPDTRPITKSEITRTYDAVFSWRSGMILTLFFSALIAFCILAWDKATGISAEEKREVGILKAIGWSTSDVLELKFWEGAVISVTSFLLGLIVAFVHVFLCGASMLAPVLKGWSVLFPEFHLTPHLDLYQVFALGFLTVVPYIASTVIPSWKVSITDPEEVMRT